MKSYVMFLDVSKTLDSLKAGNIDIIWSSDKGEAIIECSKKRLKTIKHLFTYGVAISDAEIISILRSSNKICNH